VKVVMMQLKRKARQGAVRLMAQRPSRWVVHGADGTVLEALEPAIARQPTLVQQCCRTCGRLGAQAICLAAPAAASHMVVPDRNARPWLWCTNAVAAWQQVAHVQSPPLQLSPLCYGLMAQPPIKTRPMMHCVLRQGREVNTTSPATRFNAQHCVHAAAAHAFLPVIAPTLASSCSRWTTLCLSLIWTSAQPQYSSGKTSRRVAQ
jgi:hypothetical protein